MAKRILCIGGHVGDLELTAGAVMASNAVDGGENFTLALTAGERGNPPHISVADYRKQKIQEAEAFASMVNGKAYVLDYPDAELPNNEQVRYEVANYIRKICPDIIITHWKSEMHKDHNNTHYIVTEAAGMAPLDCDRLEGERCPNIPVYYAENWEDSSDFQPYIYVDVTRGYDLWCKALHTHWIVMNSTSFPYYDYYTTLARLRGCLNKTKYAMAFDVPSRKKVIRTDMLLSKYNGVIL